MVQIPKWQVFVAAIVLLAGAVFAAPNLLSPETRESLPEWARASVINPGLDLQGGSYVLFEVEIETAIEERLQSVADEIRRSLRQAKIQYTGLAVEQEGVSFQLRDPTRSDEAREAIDETVQGFLVDRSAGSFRLTFEQNALRELKTNILEQSIEVVRRRIDETGTREPSIQRQGERRILVQLPGVDNPQQIIDIIGKTAKLTFRFVNENADPYSGRVPPGTEILESDEEGTAGQPRRYAVLKRTMVSGENLVDAQATFQDGQPVVSFRFDAVGARRFGDATRQNVGRLFAIVLDNRVISAPVINEPIPGGTGIISGRFTVQEVQDLALLLRAGALPAPMTDLEQRVVGATLGADSVAAGKAASILGLIFVIVFMAVAYGTFGVIADLALIANLILIVAVLSGLQATLTLPGIAGIVLTMGMAVDANVLIFERIREEARGGRGPVTAIDAGYRRALVTIVDANLTTLIAAVILAAVGTGPVRGFAVTLVIGLGTSMFTAILVTRLIVVGWLRRVRRESLPI